MKVYLAGPINGQSDQAANKWRDEATLLIKALGHSTVNPMVRDYRGLEDMNVKAIVEDDKADIDSADAVIAYCPQPSVGTSMEVMYAQQQGKRVFVVVPLGGRVSPWLRYHATRVVSSVPVAAILATKVEAAA